MDKCGLLGIVWMAIDSKVQSATNSDTDWLARSVSVFERRRDRVYYVRSLLARAVSMRSDIPYTTTNLSECKIDTSLPAATIPNHGGHVICPMI